MLQKNQSESAAKIIAPLSTNEKFIIKASSKHVQKRLLSLPYKVCSFDSLTMRQQLEFLKLTNGDKVRPDLSKPVEVPLQGVFGVDYLLNLFALVRKLDDNRLLKLYLQEFTEGSEEAKKLGLYLETGISCEPTTSSKLTPEEPIEEAEEIDEK